MEVQNYKIDLSGLKEIPFDKYEKDFTFIVDGRSYHTSRFLADLLSPIIRKYHETDESLNKFYINTHKKTKSQEKSNKNSPDYFLEILDLVKSDEQTISDSNRIDYYIDIFLSLGNETELCKFQPQFKETLNLNNVYERIQIMQRFYSKTQGKDLKFNINKEIDFIASHFYEINKEELKNIDISIIELILSNDKIQLEDENSLLDFVIELYQKNEKNSNLFEYVDFSAVDQENIEEFVNTFDLNDINLSIWKMICKRIIQTSPSKKVNQLRYHKEINDNVKVFELKSKNELNGIFKYLSDQTKGNIHDKGIINVTTNSLNINHQPKNLVDLRNTDYFDTLKENGSKIVCFDFKNMKVKIKNYSIRSIYNPSYTLKSWFLEISNDGNKWTQIHKIKNSHDIKGDGSIVSFNVEEDKSDFARFVRFRHEGPDWLGHNDISFDKIEFYGLLEQNQ